MAASAQRGRPGPAGPPGQTFEFDQMAPSSVWTVVHNLGRHPAAVTVYDTANTEIVGGILYDSDDQLTLVFSAPISGRVMLV